MIKVLKQLSNTNGNTNEDKHVSVYLQIFYGTKIIRASDNYSKPWIEDKT